MSGIIHSQRMSLHHHSPYYISPTTITINWTLFGELRFQSRDRENRLLSLGKIYPFFNSLMNY